MAGVLERSQLAQHDGMAQMNIRRRGIDPELDPQWTAFPARLRELDREHSIGQAVDGIGSQPIGLANILLGWLLTGFGHPGQC